MANSASFVVVFSVLCVILSQNLLGVVAQVNDTDPRNKEVLPGNETSQGVKPIDVKPVDVKPVDVKPVDVKPVDVKPVEAKPVDVKPVEVKPVEVKPVEVKPVEVKPVEVKPVEVKPVEVKPEEKKPEEKKPEEKEPKEEPNSKVEETAAVHTADPKANAQKNGTENGKGSASSLCFNSGLFVLVGALLLRL